MKKISDLFIKIKMYGLKKTLKFIFNEITIKQFYEIIRKSYSQRQEDLFIDNYFRNKKKGFYVDIEANDPHRFSNTKRFYNKGWRGINIEPDSINFNKFLKDRERDINLNIGIGISRKKLKFYKFIPDTLSTFSKEESHKYIKLGHTLESEINVEVRPLSGVLKKYYQNKIDFFSIDTEGFDMQVLMSNNWKLFRPKLICIESIQYSSKTANKNIMYNHEIFLNKIGYHKIYDNGLNSIFEVNL